MDMISNLPAELIREILLRLPVKCLLLLRCVSKSWRSLISDPTFPKSHFELSSAHTHRLLFYQSNRNHKARSYDLDALFRHGHGQVVNVPIWRMKPSRFNVLPSCRGFVLLDRFQHFIISNPVTGSCKQIRYPHSNRNYMLACGLGYDPSNDDYLLVLGLLDIVPKPSFYFFSLRANSWKNIEGPVPDEFPFIGKGLFLNGAIHWVGYPTFICCIFIFDTLEKRFSSIPPPEGVAIRGERCCLLALRGCLTLHYWNCRESRNEIWVMKEYKVRSSWTLYKIFDQGFLPLGFSNDVDDIIGFDYKMKGFSKYNFNGEMLDHFTCQEFEMRCMPHATYRESLLSLPNESSTIKKKGRQARNKKNELEERKRIKERTNLETSSKKERES